MKKHGMYLLPVMALLVLGGCADALFGPSPDPARGKGTVLVRIDGAGAARTLMPQRTDFAYYTLSFSSAGKEPHTVEYWTGSVVSLEYGTWTLAVVAFTEIEGIPYRGAAGTSEPFTVGPGPAGTVAVTLTTQSGGTGFFTYTVEVPSFTPPVQSATLTITPLGGTAGAETTVTLDKAPGTKTGTLTLDAGFYLVQVSLKNGPQAAAKTEAAQIYQNLETKGVFTFTDKDFANVIRISGTVTNTKFSDYNMVKVHAYRDDDGTEITPVSGGGIATGAWQMELGAEYTGVPLQFRVELKKGTNPVRFSKITPLTIPISGMRDIALTVEGYTVSAPVFANGRIELSVTAPDSASSGSTPGSVETFEGVTVTRVITSEPGYQLVTGSLTHNTFPMDELVPKFTMPREDVVIGAQFAGNTLAGTTSLYIGNSTAPESLLESGDLQYLLGKVANPYVGANNGGTYTIVLAADETYTAHNNLTYSGNPPVTITLLGSGIPRNVKSPFTVGNNVTLVLGDKISLTGITSTVTTTQRPVLVNLGGTLIMEDGSGIVGNSATSNSGSSYLDYDGGGVYVDKGTFIMNGGVIKNNHITAKGSTYIDASGGGVYVTGDDTTKGTFTMNGGVISGNIVESSRTGSGGSDFICGGGVFVTSFGRFTMTNGIISGNTLVTSGGGLKYFQGGGVHVLSSGTFTLSGGAIRDGSHEGVYLNGGTFTMTGGSITNHAVGISGVGNATMEIGGGAGAVKISNNAGNGVSGTTTTITMYDGIIENNGGNGVSGTTTTITMHGGIIENNGGRGISGTTTTITMHDGAINGNKGGGVSGNVTMHNGAISGNSAVNGGGVEGTLTMYGGEMKDNTATGNGGGVNGTLTMSGGTISGNSAVTGGGVYAGGASTITGGIIQENTAKRGDGIYAQADLTLDGHAEIIDDGIHLAAGGRICFTTTTAITRKVPVDLDSDAAAGKVVLFESGVYTGTSIPLPISRFPLRNFVDKTSPYATTPMVPGWALGRDGKLEKR
jgi:hypothetical protein